MLTTYMYDAGSSALINESIDSLTKPFLNCVFASKLQTPDSLQRSENSYARSNLGCSIC